MSGLDVAAFVEGQVKAIKEALGEEKALIAVSGGVDSTVSAALIDDHFMRLGEPDMVRAALSAPPLNLPVRVLKEKDRFMEALEGLSDAEE